MKQVGKFKLYSSEEALDRHFGKIGTPRRDEFERDVAASVQAYHVGEALKKARIAKGLTQEEVGERMGLHRAQVCRMESGRSITLASMMRAFKALGVECFLEMKGIGKVAL